MPKDSTPGYLLVTWFYVNGSNSGTSMNSYQIVCQSKEVADATAAALKESVDKDKMWGRATVSTVFMPSPFAIYRGLS